MCSPVSEKAKNDLKSYVNYYGNQTNVTVETFPMTGLPPEYQSGYFYPPTLLIHNTLSTMPILGPFGPVTNVFFYDHDQPNFFNTQFLPYLMGQDYALANAIFSDSQSKLDQFSMASKAGVHGINMPPNGNQLAGRDLVLAHYLQDKTVLGMLPDIDLMKHIRVQYFLVDLKAYCFISTI